MKKFRKTKISLFIVLTIMLTLGFSSSISAAEKSTLNDLNGKELLELNLILDDMTEDVNKQLREGKTEAKAIGYFKGEPFELSFNTNIPSKSNDLIQPTAVNSRSFSVTLKNNTAFKFTHELYADWSYNPNTTKIISVNANSHLTGFWYSKSDKTRTAKQTSSIHNVYSKGTFKALKIGAEHTTDFHVRVTGTGSHVVERAKIN